MDIWSALGLGILGSLIATFIWWSGQRFWQWIDSARRPQDQKLREQLLKIYNDATRKLAKVRKKKGQTTKALKQLEDLEEELRSEQASAYLRLTGDMRNIGLSRTFPMKDADNNGLD